MRAFRWQSLCICAALAVLAWIDVAWSLPGQNAVAVRILWENRRVAGAMKLYEVDAKRRYEVWEMGNRAKLENLPVADEIPDGRLSLSRGGKRTFVLVMKNDTPQAIHFFAAPHVVNPPEYALGFKFKCLCVNHVFHVPPGHYWYRIVQLQLAPEFVGDHLDIQHTLIPVAADQPTPTMDKGEMGHAM